MRIYQIPETGTHLLHYAGDALTFSLTSDTPFPAGKAFLRTNLGNGRVRLNETVSIVDSGTVPPGQDWYDIPMGKKSATSFTVKLALLETGHFEAKAYFIPENSEDSVWPDGHNVHVNVGPAGFCCGNSIYCAFVRQFGANKCKMASALPENISQKEIFSLDQCSYSVIPPSGTFRDLIGELDHIFGTLKCRILHLLPVNPTPTVYARMGRFGSPYASTDLKGIDPALAVFDRSATPLEQFLELVDAVHVRKGKLMIDIAVNHTGWASRIHAEHPEWLVRKESGEIVSPGAWGTVWEDLTELDYSKKELWKYIAEVFLEWCSRGVDGFRCDAGYMIPVPAWEYIIARVRMEYPDTIFLLEGLGGDPAVTAKLMDYASMNWAYSELFQNYSRSQIESYLHYAWKESHGNGLMVHYAETHDNNRLAAVSQTYAKMRTTLCALASVNGAFGFANGVEWFAKEKIDVHENRALSWGNPENQVEYIGRLNALLRTHSAFHNGAHTDIVGTDSPDAVLMKRSDPFGKHAVFAAVNLNCSQKIRFSWELAGEKEELFYDLLSGKRISLHAPEPGRAALELEAGEGVCLSPDEEDLRAVERICSSAAPEQEKTDFQEAMAMALKIVCGVRGAKVLEDEEIPEELARRLLHSPEDFLYSFKGKNMPAPFVRWNSPEDLKRLIMIPPGFFLLVTAPVRFRAVLCVDGKNVQQYDSLKDEQGRHFAIFLPAAKVLPHKKAALKFYASVEGKMLRREAHLLLLASDITETNFRTSHREIRSMPLTFIQTNGCGALSHLRLDRPEVSSRYDAILLANLNPDHPEDRHIMFRRFRMWLYHHARQQEVSLCCLDYFDRAADGGGLWHYHIPTGNGLYVDLTLKIRLEQGKNTVHLQLYRHPAAGKAQYLPDDSCVKLICRPDVEDRNFHYSTKARDVEKIWPGCVSSSKRGFDFSPAETRTLSLTSSKGRFCRSDEWIYMLWEANEAARGLDPHSDVYSPGYFEIPMTGGETAGITACVLTQASPERSVIPACSEKDFLPEKDLSLEHAMIRSMRDFVVRRDHLKTVIAGYPWFLDWGRDTLIAARGLVCVPEFRNDVKLILKQFALYEDRGTIPNIIHGNDVGNRDTSDAPLWLFTAAADLCREEKNDSFLCEEIRHGETFLDILVSIAEGYLKGTPNGICADPDSGLVFSPAHFTWMDTNYPAGTPREGYPVEIQALWFAALRFLSEHVHEKVSFWRELSEKVRASVLRLYLSDDGLQLSDCLHCTRGVPAERAEKDDHVRPNQIFAVTLGLVPPGDLARSIAGETASLLVPGGIRSLADAPVHCKLPVYTSNGSLLNDPSHPYWGHYEGDEDTRRKPAYHNGTVWTWPFPSYCEALVTAFGPVGIPAARALLSSSEIIMHEGCIGQIAEILDGDYPHTQRGCGAQAWSMTEFYRVWKILHENEIPTGF